jgi:uncharacterized protein
MSQRTEIYELGQLRLHSGEGRQLRLEVPVDGFDLGGQHYEPDGPTVPVLLDVSHTTRGYALRLRYDVRLHGPCMRCLDDADRETHVDAYEIDQPGGGEELTSPYVSKDELDVRSWARDALVLALPTQIVCRDDCKGLCAVCGENLNSAGEDHTHDDQTDSRWAKLGELRFE